MYVLTRKKHFNTQEVFSQNHPYCRPAPSLLIAPDQTKCKNNLCLHSEAYNQAHTHTAYQLQYNYHCKMPHKDTVWLQSLRKTARLKKETKTQANKRKKCRSLLGTMEADIDLLRVTQHHNAYD